MMMPLFGFSLPQVLNIEPVAPAKVRAGALPPYTPPPKNRFTNGAIVPDQFTRRDVSGVFNPAITDKFYGATATSPSADETTTDWGATVAGMRSRKATTGIAKAPVLTPAEALKSDVRQQFQTLFDTVQFKEWRGVVAHLFSEWDALHLTPTVVEALSSGELQTYRSALMEAYQANLPALPNFQEVVIGNSRGRTRKPQTGTLDVLQEGRIPLKEMTLADYERRFSLENPDVLENAHMVVQALLDGTTLGAIPEGKAKRTTREAVERLASSAKVTSALVTELPAPKGSVTAAAVQSILTLLQKNQSILQGEMLKTLFDEMLPLYDKLPYLELFEKNGLALALCQQSRDSILKVSGQLHNSIEPVTNLRKELAEAYNQLVTQDVIGRLKELETFSAASTQLNETVNPIINQYEALLNPLQKAVATTNKKQLQLEASLNQQGISIEQLVALGDPYEISLLSDVDGQFTTIQKVLSEGKIRLEANVKKMEEMLPDLPATNLAQVQRIGLQDERLFYTNYVNTVQQSLTTIINPALNLVTQKPANSLTAEENVVIQKALEVVLESIRSVDSIALDMLSGNFETEAERETAERFALKLLTNFSHYKQTCPHASFRELSVAFLANTSSTLTPTKSRGKSVKGGFGGGNRDWQIRAKENLNTTINGCIQPLLAREEFNASHSRGAIGGKLKNHFTATLEANFSQLQEMGILPPDQYEALVAKIRHYNPQLPATPTFEVLMNEDYFALKLMTLLHEQLTGTDVKKATTVFNQFIKPIPDLVTALIKQRAG